MSLVDQTGTDPSSAGYFEWIRHDILQLVPKDAEVVLSVGCGAGATEKILVDKGIRVLAIEADPKAAAVAEGRGVEIIGTDAESGVDRLLDQAIRIDCLIFADVLEHLTDPAKVVCETANHLQPEGTVLISVPNFRHITVLWSLFVKGEVVYESAGILDRTHVRITTRKMVERWLNQSCLYPKETIYKSSKRRERLFRRLSFGLLDEFLGSQIIVSARN